LRSHFQPARNPPDPALATEPSSALRQAPPPVASSAINQGEVLKVLPSAQR
jgi:hypothetical protein